MAGARNHDFRELQVINTFGNYLLIYMTSIVICYLVALSGKCFVTFIHLALNDTVATQGMRKILRGKLYRYGKLMK